MSKMDLTLIIEEPDIILVETLDDMNTSAIVFNVSTWVTGYSRAVINSFYLPFRWESI